MLEFDECVLEKVSGSPKLKLGFVPISFVLPILRLFSLVYMSILTLTLIT